MSIIKQLLKDIAETFAMLTVLTAGLCYGVDLGLSTWEHFGKAAWAILPGAAVFGACLAVPIVMLVQYARYEDRRDNDPADLLRWDLEKKRTLFRNDKQLARELYLALADNTWSRRNVIVTFSGEHAAEFVVELRDIEADDAMDFTQLTRTNAVSEHIAIIMKEAGWSCL